MATTLDADWVQMHADALIGALLDAHCEESDAAAEPLVDLLRVHAGDMIREVGDPGVDYTAIVEYGGSRYLIEHNNGWTRVYDPVDAEYDVNEVLGREKEERR